MSEIEQPVPGFPEPYDNLQHPGRRAGDRVDAERVLAGGGEAGALMRATDWSKTPLGPVARWSEALRTMVGVLLRNRFPLMLLWGPELVQLYNDAYRPIFGAKHRRAMGQPARECWSGIWPIIGPMLESPLRGQPATASDDLLLLIDRNGFLEETHFKLAFSPVPDDTVEATGIGGVLATVAETTEHVYAERQLRTLRELGARTADAATPRHVCEVAADAFSENAFDIPFALFYLVEPGGKVARLAASCGFHMDDGPANPSSIALEAGSSDDDCWPVFRILKADVIQELRQLPRVLPRGPWSMATRYALGHLLAHPSALEPFGVMIVGCNPHRELDDRYRGFFELATAQIAGAIRNASAIADLLHTVRLAETFVNVIGHDLRNPLSAVATAGALLGRRSESETSMKLIRLITTSSCEMSSMIDQMVDFARIRLGQGVELARSEVNLADICQAVAAEAEAAHRCSVTLSSTGDLLGFWDKNRLRQVVTTLIDHGSGNRSKDSAVLVRLDGSQPSSVALEVWNAWVIEPERMATVFEPTAEALDEPGHGGDARLALALYLGRQVVMAHGGTVRVESSQPQGTRFLVELPRFADEPRS